MRINPILRKMGFGPEDRVAIIHADDVGMFQATVPAFADVIEFGIVSSGSVMVPCPWFPYAAEWCSRHTGLDIGIHLTLTSEWAGYRWGPVFARDPQQGLLDEGGYFHRTVKAVCERAQPDAVYAEMKAQVDLAKSMGISPTHIDCHMFTAMEPEFVSQYLRLSSETGLPALIFRRGPKEWRAREEIINQWEEDGLPIFDKLFFMGKILPSDDPLQKAKEALDNISPGLNCLLIHPALDTPELRAVVPNWRQRAAEHAFFLSPQLLDYLRESDVSVITYRLLQQAMISSSQARRDVSADTHQ